MILYIKLLKESYLFARQSIVVNKLRTFLSLLGITIGIFAVIAVFTIVDSMENTIRKNIETLGDKVLFIQKWPWAFGSDYPWWKYLNRPEAKYNELQEITKRSNTVEFAAFMISTNKTVMYNDRSIENVMITSVSHDYNRVFNIHLSMGRYFTSMESSGGKNVVIIGSSVAENLFENINPLGKVIKVFGRKLEVIGVLKKEGKDLFGNSSDNQLFVPINFSRSVLDIHDENLQPVLVVKIKPFVSIEEAKDELTGVMRAIRRLKPCAENNFSINETDLLTKGFDNIFHVLTIAGWIIGGFSLLVGGFGIANIMFVSVKERTSIIGIKKSMGAKNYVILLEFLFEAILLCIIGGLFGLLFVFIGTLIVSSVLDMDLSLTFGNIILGIIVSVVIGIVSGYIPAYMASKLDPVEAIRTGN